MSKKSEEKGYQVKRVKPLIPSWEIDVLIEEEQIGKTEKKERNKEWASYDLQGSYDEPILLLPPGHRDIIYIYGHSDGGENEDGEEGRE